ncbi:MAG: tetratricopeptide repeat protein [Erythrobacter sp.]
MIRYLFPYSTIALAAALSACSPDPDTSFANARESFAANDFRSARVSLISGLRDRPGDHEMRLLLARAQLALGDGEGAAATLEKLPQDLAQKPGVALVSGEAEVLRGRFDSAIERVEGIETSAADRIRALALIGLEKPDAAAEAFATGAARDKQDAGLLASYARFTLLQDEPDQAEALVGRALKLDPRQVEAHLVRARIHEARNEVPAALADYERVLELHPRNYDGRIGKAATLVTLDRLDEARTLVAELSQEAPDDAQVAFLDARIAGKQGDWARVRAVLQPLEADLRQASAMPGLYGQALLELKQPALAQGILEPAFKRQPGSRSLRVLVARARLATKDAAGALSVIRPLASRPDATPEELELAAQAAKASGSDSAKGFEQRIGRPSAEWIGGELAKADRALRNSQWRDAASYYETILSRTNRDNAMVLNNLAFAKQKLGQDEEALQLALRAAKLEPDNPSILDTAGWLLVRTGSKARGLEMLRRAARLDPDNATITRHLAEAERN